MKIYEVVNGYNCKRVRSLEEATDVIKSILNSSGIKYTQIYEHTKGDTRVVIYQYDTLYLEMFVVQTCSY